MKIGLLGCLLNNENLGCVALTYSLINTLEQIGKSQNKKYYYYIFEACPNADKNKYISEKLNIDNYRIKSFDITPLYRKRRFIHHFVTGIETFRNIIDCDIFIDLTGGDSFTDIYGQYIFNGGTNVKYLIKKIGKKLVLGPQTYGPFKNIKNTNKAIRIIEKADLVISRDQISADFLKDFTNKEINITTDLAFELPYNKRNKINNDQNINVGLNVSGLLSNHKTESTDLSVKNNTDYDLYIKSIINWMLDQNKYSINIIPHVGNDGNEWVRKIYGDKLKYYNAFQDPMEAKSVISSMDIFIGSRMHATIAAFSSGVATIPVAYSRKFSGLFERLKYPYTIDLYNNTTELSIESTLDYINNYKLLKDNVNKSSEIFLNGIEENRRLLKQVICSND